VPKTAIFGFFKFVTAESLCSVIVCVAAAAYCVDSVSGSVALAIKQSLEATVGR